ncbi:Protein-glutamate methylesterase/protein-glutamine glutaminase [Paenibacillus allorhizoplanae]|uniref:Protein-glutamate methylesterase/protein-glutamine glutaminase n=1 Tax=Paenibacillus allorhizoplanae TaxID=2905648 RepID=A0ABN8GWP9_9BACL|nr:response regulator [Paenibacillus allorhizoplanae]CAH1216675.1 Protein-glutamate methylesterase/protein-glutamine glutaminase [Paenibacillus allorhizoplanae]
MKGKLLLVDDEHLIRRGLSKMIEASHAGWTVIGEAENGVQALSLIEELEPDLVITDIRMPEMDGVELCQRISELGRSVDVMVLTAHKDFEFAQAALRYGAIDFLLKPISAQELAPPLEKAYRLYAERQEQAERSQLERNRLFEHHIQSWLLGLPMDEDTVARLQTTCANRKLLVFTVDSYAPPTKGYRREDARLLQFALLNMMKEWLAISDIAGSIANVKHDVFAVLTDKSDSLTSFELGLVASTQSLLGLTLRPEAYESMRSLYGHFASYEGSSKAELQIPDHAARSKSIQSEVMSFIVQGKTEQLREYLEVHLRQVIEMNVNDAKIEGLSTALAIAAASKRALEGEDAEEKGLGEWIEALQPIRLSSEVAEWLSKQIQAFMWQLNSWLAGKNVNLLDKAIAYMERNYEGACSIHDVAQHVYLSVSYFSNLFKKETGESYTNYLTKFRLEKAKILLSNTNMKISEIAESVGYEDPNYFTTVFRTWVHCSPSEFRKMG